MTLRLDDLVVVTSVFSPCLAISTQASFSVSWRSCRDLPEAARPSLMQRLLCHSNQDLPWARNAPGPRGQALWELERLHHRLLPLPSRMSERLPCPRPSKTCTSGRTRSRWWRWRRCPDSGTGGSPRPWLRRRRRRQKRTWRRPWCHGRSGSQPSPCWSKGRSG